MWVKICGNTNLEDAALAAELGADAVGFVFAESKRQVTAAQVAAITPHLPANVERVGVFSSQDADEIAHVAAHAGLTAVQLHGGLDEELIAHLTQSFAGNVRIIQTLHWAVAEQPQPTETSTPEQFAAQLSAQIDQVAALETADRVLIDSKIGSARGGTGIAFDWSAAREVFSSPRGLRLIVAGGLTPANVAHAIAQLQPWGVDVSSGVEALPGKKDPTLVERFIRNARGIQTP